MQQQSKDGQQMLEMPQDAPQKASTEEQKSSDELQKSSEGQKNQPPSEEPLFGKTLEKSQLLPAQRSQMPPPMQPSLNSKRTQQKMPKIEFIYALDSPRYRFCCCAARVSALVFAFIIAFYSLMHLIGSCLYAASESIPGLFIIFFFVSPMLGLIGSVLSIVGFFTKLSLLFILSGIANALYLLLAAVAITLFIVAGINYQVNVTGECPLLPPWFHTLVRAWYKLTESHLLEDIDRWACKLFVMSLCASLVTAMFFKLLMATIFEFNIWRAYLQARSDEAIRKTLKRNCKPRTPRAVGNTPLNEYAALPADPNADHVSGSAEGKAAAANKDVEAIPTVSVYPTETGATNV